MLTKMRHDVGTEKVRKGFSCMTLNLGIKHWKKAQKDYRLSTEGWGMVNKGRKNT